MATGTDFLLESLLRLAGVDVEKAKREILSLGQKFHDQDALLKRIASNQETILSQQSLIMCRLKIQPEQNHEQRSVDECVSEPVAVAG